MNENEFNEYINEYLTQGIGNLIYNLIITIVRETTRRYPPEYYSPNYVWDDDAIFGLAHDFTLRKLLENGRIEYYLLTTSKKSALRQVLTRDFRHYLINQKRSTEANNLFERARNILRSDQQFQFFEGKGWGLRSWVGKDVEVNIQTIVSTMFIVELPPFIKYRVDSKKLSPIITNSELKRLLLTNFEILDKCISLDHIIRALRYRLFLIDDTFISLDNSQKLNEDKDQISNYAFQSVSNDFVTELGANEIAEDIFERITDQQRKILVLLFNDLTLDQISEKIQISRSSVHNELRRITDLIKASNPSEQEADQILSQLSQLSYEHQEQNVLDG